MIKARNLLLQPWPLASQHLGVKIAITRQCLVMYSTEIPELTSSKLSAVRAESHVLVSIRSSKTHFLGSRNYINQDNTGQCKISRVWTTVMLMEDSKTLFTIEANRAWHIPVIEMHNIDTWWINSEMSLDQQERCVETIERHVTARGFPWHLKLLWTSLGPIANASSWADW